MYRLKSLRLSPGLVVGMLALIVATAGAATATTVATPGKTAATAAATTKLVHVKGPVVRLERSGQNGDIRHSIAYCPRGSRVVSGGFTTITAVGETFISDGIGTGWWVSASNESDFTTGTVQAFAYCARTGRAITTSVQPMARENLAVVRENLAAERKMAAVRHAQTARQ